MNNLNDFCHMLVVEDGTTIKTYYLEKEAYTIGRDPINELVINDSKVSRHHAIINKKSEPNENNCYVIKDGDLQGNKSKNGLVVNGKLKDEHELKHGDLLRFSSQATASYYIVSNISIVNFFHDNNRNPGELLPLNGNNQALQQTLPTDYDSLSVSEDLVRLASFPEFSPNPIIEIDMAGKITYINAAAVIKFPDIRQKGISHPILAGLIESNSNRRGNLLVKELAIKHEYFQQYIHYLSARQLIRIYIFDLTERVHFEISLKESEEKYRAVVNQISDSIFLIEAISHKIVEANPAYCDLLGYTSGEILKLKLEDILHDCESFLGNIYAFLEKNPHFLGEAIHKRKDGSLVDVEVSVSMIHYLESEMLCFTVRDITSRKRTRELLQYQAFHDLLTGLPNRRLFNEQLTTSVANAKRYGYYLGLMYVDIDHFKSINDTFGHPAGDKLLEGFAHRLKSCLRASDTIARFGGDEFAILLPQVNHLEDTAKLAERLMDALKQPFEIFGENLEIKSSIGIALYPQDGDQAETLINKADMALLRTKSEGRNNYQFYSSIRDDIGGKNYEREELLSIALSKQEFFLLYQPIINLHTQNITGLKTFLRCHGLEAEEIFPENFIRQGEKSGLILSLGEWVMRSACTQHKAWQNAGLVKIPISIKVSPLELQQVDLVSKIESVLVQVDLEPDWLELEVTQKSLKVKNYQVSHNLKALSALGVRLCLEDFGVESLSISPLKDFKFNSLKIQQSLIAQINKEDQEEDKGLISAIIALGRGFELKVIAEGVETKEQLQFLQSLQCCEILGNTLMPPMKSEQFSQFVGQGKQTFVGKN